MEEERHAARPQIPVPVVTSGHRVDLREEVFRVQCSGIRIVKKTWFSITRLAAWQDKDTLLIVPAGRCKDHQRPEHRRR